MGHVERLAEIKRRLEEEDAISKRELEWLIGVAEVAGYQYGEGFDEGYRAACTSLATDDPNSEF